MPILENGDFQDYIMPDEIKNAMTREFMQTLRRELYLIFNMSLCDWENDIARSSVTSGWWTAFGLACIKHDLKHIYEYTRWLDYHDKDHFGYEVVEMLVEHKQLLPDGINYYIHEQLEVDWLDFRYCIRCKRQFLISDMWLENPDATQEQFKTFYCNRCQERERGESTAANNYYKQGLKIVDETFPRPKK
jgi:hypothetical protein